MRYFIYFIVIALFTQCNNSTTDAKTSEKDTLSEQATPTNDTANRNEHADSSSMSIHNFPDSVLQDKITAQLLKISFVKKSNAYIDSFSNHKHGIAFLMDNSAVNEVTVSAGYNGDLRFETYYQFKVNTKTFDIKVYDAANDSLLTLEQYISNQKE